MSVRALVLSRFLDLAQLALSSVGHLGQGSRFELVCSSLWDSKNHQTGGFSETLGLLVWPNFPWI